MVRVGSQGDAAISKEPLSRLRSAIEGTAERSPERIALSDGSQSRTYGELAELCGHVARSPDAGRRALALGRAVADVEAVLVESLAGHGLLLLDEGTTARELGRAETLFVEAGRSRPREEVAIGLCSSGSSGLPKVVELEWDSLLDNAASFAAAAGYEEGELLWCTTPLAHLYCLGAGVLGGLLSGATVLLGQGMLEAEELAGLIESQAPAVLLSVPFLFRRYLGLLRAAPELAEKLRLRTAIAAGEPVPPDLIAAWHEFTGSPLRSHYGLTEGGQITLAGGEAEEGVGRPLGDVEVRIEADGEIAVRRRPPAAPYRIAGCEGDADGWYATGDLGHLDEAGNLHVSGRADSRLNVAGKKVDPVEVEEVLSACDGVEDSAVAGVDGPNGVEVVAFLRAEADGDPGDGEIRRRLAEQLSPHKLPRRFIRVTEIPRTLTGKVRRGALITGLAVPETGRVAAGGSMLELVRREAAAVVLGEDAAEEIDPALSFKELGFDSLAAVLLCERLAGASGLAVRANAIFDHPTPSALAAHLAALERGEVAEPSVALSGGFAAEPVAIVGMACRYPGGATSPQGLWELISAGVDATSDFPADRGWDLEHLFDDDPDHAGTSYARRGAFLDGADRFDAEFFGISPREALAMDPQQRLLLEAAWEALEDAGIDPLSRRGTATAVFAGVMGCDYGEGSPPESSEGLLITGLAESVVSGRVAYSLGLEGPAVTVNTACSSSLVAMHLACQSLRLGESSLALAGGVSVMATPAQFVEFSRQRGLAPDGRCKPFAAAADGTVWSEGVGLLVLERLSEARRNGHRVLATIRGSAINQDGASNGLTAPNGPSQELAIRQALANAGLQPADVDAVEAHGTGTALGDPIEAAALIATYGRERERPLRLGSVKSNLGHTLAAAGVAGVIKMVQAMRHGVLPKTLHVDAPSPHVDWSEGSVELLSEASEWEAGGRPRRAGVSSFGISGTNAHLILEEGPRGERVEVVAAPEPVRLASIPLPLSAKGEPALRAQAARLRSHLIENPELDPLDVGFSLASGRSRLSHRAVALGAEREELLDSLAALASGAPAAAAIGAAVPSGKCAFLFTGQGAQHAGMGRELHGAFPVFAAALEQVFAALDPHLERPLRELLFAEPGSTEAALLDRTQFTQPALFAVEVALYRLLESWGLRPDFLTGHSIGELSAAHVAGVLSLPDAAHLVAARGALMGELAEGGAMVAIAAAEEEVRESMAGLAGDLSIAAVNDSGSTVVSGEEEAAEQLAARFAERGCKTSRLRVSHAFHSHRMEPMLDELAEVAARLSLAAPRIPIVSNLSAEPLSAEEATSPRYWARQAREAVRFADSVRFLAGQGVTGFLELGPDGVLSAMVDNCLAGGEPVAAAAPLLRRDRPEVAALFAALATIDGTGAEVDWAAPFAGSGAKRIELPTYAFQRQRYWIESRAKRGDLANAGLSDAEHPLLAAVIAPAGSGERIFTGRLSLRDQAWLADHAVAGETLLPAAACLEMALWAGRELGAETVEELVQEVPLLLPATGAVQIQLRVGEPDSEGRRRFSLHSQRENAAGLTAEWTKNAGGTLAAEPLVTAASRSGAKVPAGAEPVAVEHLYERLGEAEIEYGPAFRGLRAAWRDGSEIFAEVEIGDLDGEGDFDIHPALLDAALHAGFLTPQGGERLPFAWSGVRLHAAAGKGPLKVRLSPAAEGFSLLLCDASGAPLLSVEHLALRPLDRELLRASAEGESCLFHLAWEEVGAAGEENGAGAAEVEVRRFDAGEASDPAGAAFALTARVLEEVGEWLAGEQDVKLALLTSGAVDTREGELPDPALASVWGLLRSAQAEHPERLLLIDSDGSDASEAVLWRALRLQGEPQLAIRAGRLLAPRLQRLPLTSLRDAPSRSADPEATTLISGGTGTLGALVARHLVVEHGARQLILAGRRGDKAPGAIELKAELEGLGAEVELAACDFAERDQVAALIASIAAERPLRRVIHAAGVVDDGVFASLTAERLATVMAPKVQAAWNLHELTAEIELTEFVLFSSVAASLGSPGQANYSAANAFLEALAVRRRAEGLPAQAIAWGLWESESTISAALGEAERQRIRRVGTLPISDERGLRLFDLATRSAEPLLMAAPIDLGAMRVQARSGTLAAHFRKLVPVPVSRRAAASIAVRVAELGENERREALLDLVRAEAAAVLGHAGGSQIPAERSFESAGLDSLGAVEMRNRLSAALDKRLPATAIFDYPNPLALSEYLAGQLNERDSGGGAGPELDKLELLLASAGEEERRQILARLRALLARTSLESDPGGTTGDRHEDLEAASDEEVIKLIEEEFGAV